jgi:ADP-heptose:LPS heptosyltransferase
MTRDTSIGSVLVYVSSGVDDALGENILKLPMLLALADQFPGARISWVPGTSGFMFLERHLAPLVGGRIHEFITDLEVPIEPWNWPRVHHAIRAHRFDLVIDTQRNLGRTLLLRQIPHRRFVSGTWRYLLSDRRPPRGVAVRPRLLVEKLTGLVAAAAGRPVAVANPIPVPEAWQRRAASLLPAGPTYVGMAPGHSLGARADKGWPLDNFLALARLQVERGRTPVIVLGPEQRAWQEPVRSAVPSALVPELDSGEAGPAAVGGPTLTVALGGRVAAAIANDSGPGHLLAVGGAPMVSLFGPTRPEKYAPFARALIIVRAQDYGSDRMASIPVEAVAEAVERQVAVGPARRD